MSVCCICHKEKHTYTFDGGELCWDCLLEISQAFEFIEKKLPEFIKAFEFDFIDWVTNTEDGDVYGIQDYVRRAKAKAVKEWAKDNPSLYQEAIHDFRTSTPGEWEDFIKESERSA